MYFPNRFLPNRLHFFCNLIIVLLLLSTVSCKNNDAKTELLNAPRAKKIADTFREHGRERIDYYQWLSNREDTAVIHQLEAENNYVDRYLRHTAALQDTIYNELVSRIEQDYVSLPTKSNGYWYYTRYEQGKQYPLYCRKKETTTAPEEIMLNVNDLAEGHEFYSVYDREISRDNQWLAYAEDTTGGRQCRGQFYNLVTKTYSPEKLKDISGEFVWANDSRTVYYVTNDHTVRPYKVWKHVLGTDPAQDKLLYTETDSTFNVTVSASENHKYIFIISGSTNTTEARYLNADNPDAAPVLIQKRKKDLLYYPDYYEGDQFVIFNNDKAKNFKLSQTPIASTAVSSWKDIVPAQDSGLLVSFEMFRDYLVTQHTVKGLAVVTVINRKNSSAYKIDFGEQAYVAYIESATDQFDQDSIRYSYTSLTTPYSEYTFNLSTREKKLLKQQKVGGNYDASLYQTERIWAPAADGVLVPVSLVYRKDLFKKDGTNPMLLYAYGSYGYSTDADFDASVISLLDRGFVYAIAHIRGGQEMGRYWYEDGRQLKKKNTFTDFIDCAAFLEKEKYTSADRMFANGGSAGGMLMGAITNLRPDLFKGILAEVPWMDVITDMYNPDLPLTTLEYEEWGDPHDDNFYNYMISWSPYDNIKPTKFPAILATGGLNDTQVPYYSPAKWVQKIRDNNTGDAPVLFKCNMGAGHGGASGRFERQKLTALKYAFMIDQLKGNR